MSVPSSDFGASFFDLAGPLAGPAAAAKTPPGPAHAAAAAPSAPAYGEAALTPFEWRLMQEPLSESLTRFPELRVTSTTDPKQVLNALLWIDNLLSAEQQQQVVGSKRKRQAAGSTTGGRASQQQATARDSGEACGQSTAATRCCATQRYFSHRLHQDGAFRRHSGRRRGAEWVDDATVPATSPARAQRGRA